jgi:hypothetical protein
VILKSDSHFRKIPEIIPPKYAISIGTIRYVIDICDISYSRLKKSLLEIGKEFNPTQIRNAEVFSDAWCIVTNCTIFYEIVKNRELFNIGEDELSSEFKKAQYLRNTIQHIDQRITEILLESKYAVFGTLSWEQYDSSSNTLLKNLLYSGHSPNRKGINEKIPNVNYSIDKEIGKIVLSLVSKPKRNVEKYEPVVLDIDLLMNELQVQVHSFEDQLDYILKNSEVNGFYESDILIQMSGYKVIKK